MPRKKVTVYTVQTVWWDYTDEYYYRVDGKYHDSDDESLAFEGSRPVPVKSFLSREKAEAHRDELERKERGDQNPFMWGGLGESLADYTTLKAETFLDRVRALGVKPPRYDKRGRGKMFEVGGWWEDVSERMTDEQRHAVWDLLDKVRFFTVVPMQVELEG
jgi:hypothetical protein